MEYDEEKIYILFNKEDGEIYKLQRVEGSSTDEYKSAFADISNSYAFACGVGSPQDQIKYAMNMRELKIFDSTAEFSKWLFQITNF